MARLYTDFIEGTLSADPGAGGTTLNAAILASVPAVSGGDTFKLVLDPDAVGGAPEIVIITAHTASATSATVTRGQEGTTGRAHNVGTVVIGPVTATDMDNLQTGVDTPPVVTIAFQVAGDLAVAAGTKRYYFTKAFTVAKVHAKITETAPTGASVIADVNKNGTTIFTTQGNRPTIAAAGWYDADQVPDVTAYAVGDYFTMDVDQIGSTLPGTGLIVELEGSWT